MNKALTWDKHLKQSYETDAIAVFVFSVSHKPDGTSYCANHTSIRIHMDLQYI